jgi:thymidylate kinase
MDTELEFLMMNTIATTSLQTARRFFAELNLEGVRYCHWKSTHRLERALAGKTDLDLLVARADATRLREILLRNDFKSLVSAPQRQFPAIEDYLGFDRTTGSFIHLHVHYRMILGEQYVKNYVLPLEASFLEHTQMLADVRVPAPALEIIVLVLRTLLKYRDRDFVRDVIKRGHSGIPAATLKELDGLLAQTNLDQITTALKCYADFIPPALVLDFLKLMGSAPRDGWALIRLRHQARQVLAPYQRMSRMRAQLEYYRTAAAYELPLKPLRKFLIANSHKKSALGGLGLIGTDGAGKSTAVNQIVKWLAWRINVAMFYMGTTHPSRRTQLMRDVADAGHFVSGVCRRILGAENRVTQATVNFAKFLTAWSFLGDGHDRYQRFLAGQRQIAQGSVVIYDRYPLKNVLIDGRSMDGAHIAAINELPKTPMLARLARAEEKIYCGIRPPDHVIVLRVSPAVSQTRKPNHRRARIEAKAQALAEFTQTGTNITEIDAEQPLEHVLLQIKTAIWNWL